MNIKLIENLTYLPLEVYLREKYECDIFLLCTSFEERCIKSSNILASRNSKVNETVIFNYKETDPKNIKDQHTEKINEILKESSKSIRIFDTESVSNPSGGIKAFLKYLKINKIDIFGKRILIDISVFTKGYFFLLFKIFKEIFSISQIDVIYTEPKQYTFKKNTDEVILTKGLDRIETIPGFFGSSIYEDDALIVLLGFEGNRSLEVYFNTNPSITYAINGFPSFQPAWHKISMEANLRFLQESQSYERLYFAPANDPFMTSLVISKIVKKIRNHISHINITIAPLGPKTQALGALLYALKDKAIKVIYPFPSFYSPDYSYSSGPSWIYRSSI